MARTSHNRNTKNIRRNTDINKKKKTTTAITARKQPRPQPQSRSENKIVRRSRRGDKAKGSHPTVGKYAVELTSSENKWCGKFALEISTEAQLGQRLTTERFDEIFATSQEVRDLNSRHGWANHDSFYDEQLEMVLRVWARQGGLGRVQLGVIQDNEAVVVSGIPVEKKGDLEEIGGQGCRTLWVHNDNAMSIGRPCNHYSGVKLLGDYLLK